MRMYKVSRGKIKGTSKKKNKISFRILRFEEDDDDEVEFEGGLFVLDLTQENTTRDVFKILFFLFSSLLHIA